MRQGWIWCEGACRRVHRTEALHLTAIQRRDAFDFPSYWTGGLPFSIYEPYLVLEAATDEALMVAEQTAKDRACMGFANE